MTRFEVLYKENSLASQQAADAKERLDSFVNDVAIGAGYPIPFPSKAVGITISGSWVNIHLKNRDADTISLPLYLFNADDPYGEAQRWRKEVDAVKLVNTINLKKALVAKLQKELEELNG